MLDKNVLISFALLFFTQIVVFFQINGQVIWPFCKSHPWLLSLFGVPISYLFILGTEYGYKAFDAIWPIRLAGFALGIISFTVLTYFFLGEPITFKTGLCITLATLIMLIQIYM